MNELQLIYGIATNLSDYLICIGILTFLWLVGMDDGLREKEYRHEQHRTTTKRMAVSMGTVGSSSRYRVATVLGL